MRLVLAGVMVALLGTVAVWHEAPSTTVTAQSRRPAGTVHSGNAFRFNKVAEGVYHAVGTGALQVIGNSAVIVNDDDVMIVDDHVSPAAAWVLLEEVKTLTNKPVRYVVNTHFHFDHAHGNQVFGPNVEIIGHEFTRQMLLGGKSAAMPLFQNYLNGLPAAVDGLRKRADAEAAPEAKARLRSQLQAAEQNAASQKEFRSVPPTVTLRSEMTLFRGNREIQLRHLGRGHTAGDVVVLLPRERVVITGDFLTAGLSNLSDSYPDEWVASLDALKKLPFDTVLPGHGDAFTDRTKIDYFQAWLRDVWTEVGQLKRQGVPVEEAARRADLTRHKGNIPAIQGPGIPLIGAQRIYELMDMPAR
jgi:glyoxylase-like metal-dependent hydrolase (beta-lactamase superfamily II)